MRSACYLNIASDDVVSTVASDLAPKIQTIDHCPATSTIYSSVVQQLQSTFHFVTIPHVVSYLLLIAREIKVSRSIRTTNTECTRHYTYNFTCINHIAHTYIQPKAHTHTQLSDHRALFLQRVCSGKRHMPVHATPALVVLSVTVVIFHVTICFPFNLNGRPNRTTLNGHSSSNHFLGETLR